MSSYNWCHGPNCHENHTQDRIRGVKGNKVLRTKKIGINKWNVGSVWSVFCSQGCYTDFFYKYWRHSQRSLLSGHCFKKRSVERTTRLYQ